eukprot:gene22610-29751_t
MNSSHLPLNYGNSPASRRVTISSRPCHHMTSPFPDPMARVRSSRRDTPFPLPALWSARASKVALLVVAVVLSLTPCYHAMTTNGDKILNQLGETVELKGANWFGFNNGATM